MLTVLLLASAQAWAQVPPDTTRADSLRVPVDSLRLPLPDTSRAAPRPAEGGLRAPVTFSARDSVVILPRKGENVGRLYGNANVSYEDVQLTSPLIEVLLDADELRAQGVRSDTGWVALPEFQQGEESFTATDFRFNLRTNVGRFSGIRTQVEDGYLLGRVSKVIAQDSVLYVEGGGYTTCNLREPHYHLRADKIVVLNENWIVTGPVHLRIFNIPFPIWLPFSVLPKTEGRRSGPLAPDYGEDARLGFYLRGLGWYWPINDYLDAQIEAGIWTLGSWQINPSFRYNVRYKYSGNLSVDWVRTRNGEGDDPDFFAEDRRMLRWSHNQEISPTSRFNADVNLSSSGYLKTVSRNYDDNTRNTASSSITYSKSWPASKRSFALDIRQAQTFSTGSADLTLPRMTFRQSTFFPLKRRTRPPGRAEAWYERISLSYDGSLDNRFSFLPLPEDTLIARGATGIGWVDALFSPAKYRLATGNPEHLRVRATHRIPVSATYNVTSLFGRPFSLNLSPRFSYSEDWFIRSDRRELDPATNRPATTSVSDFVALRQWNIGLSGNTTFYGTFPWRIGRLNGFRHVVNPSLSFTYKPDFSDDGFGYYRSYRDTTGQEIRYAIVPGVQAGRQAALGLSVSNSFLSRLMPSAAPSDSVGASGQAQVITLFTLNLSTNYNFAADSLHLSPISFNGGTNLFNNRLALNLSGTFSPYALIEEGTFAGQTRNRLHLLDAGWPLRLQRLSISASTTFRSSQGGNTTRTPTAFGDLAQNQPVGQRDPFNNDFQNTPTGYADFSIPWSLNLDLSYSLSKDQRVAQNVLEDRFALTLNTRFDFNLTPKWKIVGQTGYDFQLGEIVTTNISVLRDLHCWEMSFNWVPFGFYQSFQFTIQVKSGHLRDILRLSQPRSDNLGDRLGSQFGL